MTAMWALVEADRVRSVVTAADPPGEQWRPVEQVIPDHDPATHRPSGATFEIEPHRVIATYSIVPIAPDVDATPPADDDELDQDDAEPQPDPTPQWLRDRQADREQLQTLTDAVDTLILDALMGGS